jgi:hypothetical protein
MGSLCPRADERVPFQGLGETTLHVRKQEQGCMSAATHIQHDRNQYRHMASDE